MSIRGSGGVRFRADTAELSDSHFTARTRQQTPHPRPPWGDREGEVFLAEGSVGSELSRAREARDAAAASLDAMAAENMDLHATVDRLKAALFNAETASATATAVATSNANASPRSHAAAALDVAATATAHRESVPPRYLPPSSHLSTSPRRLTSHETSLLTARHGARGAQVYATSLELLTQTVSVLLERLRVLKRREIILKAEISGES